MGTSQTDSTREPSELRHVMINTIIEVRFKLIFPILLKIYYIYKQVIIYNIFNFNCDKGLKNFIS